MVSDHKAGTERGQIIGGIKRRLSVRKILVVIDMQNDFIDGSLGTPEAVAIVNNVRRKIESYDRNDVYATRDTHQVDYLETQEGQNLPVEHCIEGTEGWQIRSSLASLIPSGHIYNKPTFGCLELAGEIQAITMYDEDVEIELVGLCTDICVVSNALILKAFMPEIKISVDASCCAGVTPQKHRAALETMRSCQIHVTE